MAAIEGDKYRSFIYGPGEADTVWRNGIPNYDVVNKLFEEGRTHVWEVGTVEERVQRLLKSWEMELGNKVRPQDFKTVNIDVVTHSVNGIINIASDSSYRLFRAHGGVVRQMEVIRGVTGTPGKTLAEVQQIGGYNNFLQTSLPENLRAYDPSDYTSESSNTAFATVFPRGFAIEVLEVYSGGPPKVAYKFRHWSFMEGPFQGHAPTGELVEFFGIGTFKVDESMVVQAAEFFYDPNELIAQLLKGPLIEGSEATASATTTGCPFLSKA